MKTRRELSDGQFAFMVGLPVVIVLASIIAYPFGYSVWLSFHRVVFFGGYRTNFVNVENYLSILSTRGFWWSVWVTARFTFETVVFTMAIGMGLALLLRRQLRFASLVKTILFMPWCVSLYAAGVMFSYLARGQSGVATSLASLFGSNRSVDLIGSGTIIEVLAIGSAWTLAPLVGFFLLTNMKTIPSRLYDLASIDQLTPLETFRYVTLPPLRFSLFVFTSITTVLSMKIFDFIFVLSGGGPGNASSTLTYEIYKKSFKETNLGAGSAMSVLLLILITGVTALLYVCWGRRENGIENQ